MADSAFAVIADVADNVTTLSVTGLAPPAFYRFRVRAHNPDGVSAYSNTVSLQTAFVDLTPTLVSEPPAALGPGPALHRDQRRPQRGQPHRALVEDALLPRERGRARPRRSSSWWGRLGVPDPRGRSHRRPPRSSVTIPLGATPGTYRVLACADDFGIVAESDEGNNCRASTQAVALGRPDLVTTAVGDPPPSVRRGARFTASDTVGNQGAAPAAATKVRYYLSVDTVKGSGDRLLVGTRSVPALSPQARARPAPSPSPCPRARPPATTGSSRAPTTPTP